MTAVPQSAVRCGLYVRISSDRDDSELGVKRQEKECRAYLDRRGWDLADVYVDNDISASNGDPRPAWARLLDDIEHGSIDAVVGWSVDRLTRTPRELEDVIDLNEQHGIQLGTVGGDLDLATPMGRMCARMLGAAARNEIEQKRLRQLSERRQNAEAGKVHQGGKRPFGYMPDKVTIDESEAVYVREAARRVLAGESARGICADFKARGVVGTAGAPIRMATLRQMLCSARISGRRELWQGGKGEQRPRLAPIIGPADWPGIITAEDSDALRSILTQPSRKTTTTNARRHLLPGFLTCSTCGQPMLSHRAGRKGDLRAVYVCAATDPGVKCRKQVDGEGVEAEVVSRVLSRLRSPKYVNMLHDRLGVDRTLVEQLARDSAERDEVAEERARGDLTASEWRVMRDVLTVRIDRAQALVEKQTRSHALMRLLDDDGTTIQVRWDAMTLDQRRAVLRMVVNEVVVGPGEPGRRFNGDRVKVDWAV